MTLKLIFAVSMVSALSGGEVTALGNEDPFAGEAVMTDDELREQRGGIRVDHDTAEVGGFLLHFGAQVTELSINTALSAAEGSVDGSTVATTLTFGPEARDIVIGNDLDGVFVERSLAIDVSISNFSTRRGELSMGGMVGRIRNVDRILETSGF